MKAPLIALWILDLIVCQVTCAYAQLDQYGGWTNIEAPATGHFYITQINGRHTFITPEGHAYFAMGINHLSSSRSERYVHLKDYQTDRQAMERIKEDLAYWNMNNAGGDTPELIQQSMPFFVSISLTNNAHWLPADKFEFTDVFEPGYIEETKALIKRQCERYKENKFLIGYYWTDTPRWDVLISRKRHLRDWVSYLRNLGPEAAGKQAYVAFLEQKYQTIEAFNKAYGLGFESYQSLLNGRFDHIDFHRPLVVQDDQEFLGVIADHLYMLAAETIKVHDPNHLILGEKYLAGDHPESVLKAATKYVDAISIQPGPEKGPGPGPGKEESNFNHQNFEMLHLTTGKPVLICDHSNTFYSKAYPITLWHQHETQQLAGEALTQYIRESVQQNFIIGYVHCQYLDAYDPRRGLMKQGLVSGEGERHEPLSTYIRQANGNALELVKKALLNKE